MSDLEKMKKDAHSLKRGKYDGIKFNWKDIFPEGVRSCPFQPQTILPPEVSGETWTMFRFFHGCIGSRCEVWDVDREQCGANGGRSPSFVDRQVTS